MMDVGGRAIRPLGVQLIGCQDRDPPRPGSVSIPPGRHLGRSEWSRQPSGEVVGSSRPGRDVGHRRSDDGGPRGDTPGWEEWMRNQRGGRSIAAAMRPGLTRSLSGNPALEGLGESVVGEGATPQSSSRRGIGSDVLAGMPGADEQAPWAQGDRSPRLTGGRPCAGIGPANSSRIRSSLSASDTDARRTQGWSQPARASAVDSTTMAASRKPATATFRVPRQRNERLMEGNDLADRR